MSVGTIGVVSATSICSDNIDNSTQVGRNSDKTLHFFHFFIVKALDGYLVQQILEDGVATATQGEQET